MDKIIVHENIRINGKHGRPIVADIFQPNQNAFSPVIIFSHGFKGFKNWGPFNHIAKLFALHGFVFVKINFSFNGTTAETPNDFTDLEAFGQNNFSKELDDLDATLNWVEQNAATFSIDFNRINLIGHSRGGGISIIKAHEDVRVNKVAAWASVAGFSRHITRQEIREWKKSGVHFVENARTTQMMPLYIQLYHDFIKNHRRFNIDNIVAQISKPVLFAHAVNDETIPISHITDLIRNKPSNIRLLPIQSGGHNFDTAHPFEAEELPETFQMVVNETIEFFVRG